jgi:transcriptional regulator GlxA family with amidase domain
VAQQAHEDVGQHLVGAIADEDLVLGQAVAAGDGRLQRAGLRVRVEAQGLAVLPGNRRQHLLAGAVGALVGVELDQPVDLRLLARHVGVSVRTISLQ